MVSRHGEDGGMGGACLGMTALVTGASSGIGRAIAEALAGQGAGLLLLGRDAPRLEAAIASCRAAGSPMAEARLADLAGPEEVLTAQLPQRLDILVHAAGAHGLAPVEGTTPALLDAQLAVNLRAPLLLTRAALPALRASGQGQVVFVNSTQGLSAGRGAAAYAAAKHGLRALADSLRQEVNADGIRVLSLFPGRTATPMQEALYAREQKPWRPEALMQPEDVAAMALAALLLPRTAEVTEITMRPLRPG
jgi:NAD(P)-dependent dehydrogenase (short-subunit alcohol dehydrogenase family)